MWNQIFVTSNINFSTTVNEEEPTIVEDADFSPQHAAADFSLAHSAAAPIHSSIDVGGEERIPMLNSGDVGNSNNSAQPKRYFKTYFIIPGTQTTHDFAILQVVLEHMTLHQVISQLLCLPDYILLHVLIEEKSPPQHKSNMP